MIIELMEGETSDIYRYIEKPVWKLDSQNHKDVIWSRNRLSNLIHDGGDMTSVHWRDS